MPFKVKLIKNFQKYMANSYSSSIDDKKGLHLTTSESIDQHKYFILDKDLSKGNSLKKTTAFTN